MKVLVLLLLLVISLISNVYSKSDYTLYSLTANPQGLSDPRLIVYETIYKNEPTIDTRLTNLNGYVVRGISSVNETSKTITVFCNLKDYEYYLIELNMVSGEIVSNSFSVDCNYGINNGQTYSPYIYNGDEVYLPAIVEGLEGLILLVWDFTNPTFDTIETFTFWLEIDNGTNPIGAMDYTNNLLYIAYQPLNSTYANIVTFDIGTIDDSSTSDTADTDGVKSKNKKKSFKVIGLTMINGLVANEINLLYCGSNGDIYSLSSDLNGVNVCQIDLDNGFCNNIHSSSLPLNPNSFTFTPYFQSLDKLDIVTLYSKPNNYKELLMTVSTSSYTTDTSAEIKNFWNSTGTLDYTFFAY